MVICIGVKRVYVVLGCILRFHALFMEAARRSDFHRYRENGKGPEVSLKSARGFLFAPTAPNSLKTSIGRYDKSLGDGTELQSHSASVGECLDVSVWFG